MADIKQYEQVLKQLRPQGAIWEVEDPATPVRAEMLAEVDTLFDLIAKESDVRETDILRDKWAEVYEVETEGRTLQQIRFDLALKKNAKGGASIPYFKQLGKSYGYDVEIEECFPSTCGLSECGGEDECGPEETVYVWIVTIVASDDDRLAARCGESECGDELGALPPDTQTFIDILQKYKPGHTILHINYGG